MDSLPIEAYRHANYPEGNIVQRFGINGPLYASMCVPDARFRLGRYCAQGHPGIDLVAPYATPLKAVVDAYVAEIIDDPQYGLQLRLMRPIGSGRAEEWMYGHCAEILVKVGERVRAGQTVALMGNSGFAVTGPTPFWPINPYYGTHCHLGKRYWKLWEHRVAPHLLQGEQENYDNGFFGYVNFEEELADLAGIHYSPEQMEKMLTLRSLWGSLQLAFIRSGLKTV